MKEEAIRRLILLAAVIACSEHRAPTGPSADSGSIEGINVSGLLARPFAQSSSRGAAQPSALNEAVSAATSRSVVYVSLVPGSVPDGVQATIGNDATGQSTTVAMTDGGFDPVEVPASAGDALKIAVIGRGGGVLASSVNAVSIRRPPTVIRTVPPKGKTDVPLNTHIIVVFSEPIDPASLPGAIQLLHDGTGVVGAITPGPPDFVAQLIPDKPLAPQTDYELVITAGIRSSSGDALAGAATIPFTSGVNPAPVMTVVSPHDVQAGSPGVTLTIYGSNFLPSSVVNFDQRPCPTTFVSATQLTAAIPADAIAAPHTGIVTVTNPPPGGGTTAFDDINISAVGSASPGLSLNPNFLDFANQITGTSTSKTVAVANTASTEWPFSGPRMNGFSYTDFSARTDCPTTIPPGGSCTFTVTYTPTSTGQRIGVLVFNGDQLTEVDYSATGTAIGGLSVAAAVDPSGASPGFLYAANARSNSVLMYRIGTNGTLTANGTVSAGGTPSSIAVDPAGRFVYVTNFAGNSVSTFTIAADGTLISNGAIATGTGPVAIAVAPDRTGRVGRFVFVANSMSNDVSMFSIDSRTGALIPAGLGTVGAGIGPSAIAVDPFGRFAYAASREGVLNATHYLNTTISAYAVDEASGALTLGPGSLGTRVMGYQSPTAIVVDPKGTHAYLTNANSRNVMMLDIDPTTGALIGRQAVGTEDFSTAVAVHPSGKFAYLAVAGSANRIAMLSINADGSLADNGAVAAGQYPTGIAIDASGSFAYVANATDISMYAIDAATGKLSLIGTITP